MSKPERVAVAAGAGEQAGADGAAGRAGEHAPGAGSRRLRGAAATPPEDCITSGAGSPAAAAASPSRPR